MGRRWLAAAFAVLLAPALAVAQTNGGIAGTVKDTSGAVLPGVTVTATSQSQLDNLYRALTGHPMVKVVL